MSVCKADRNMVQALLERLSREKLPHMINVQNCMRQVCSNALYLFLCVHMLYIKKTVNKMSKKVHNWFNSVRFCVVTTLRKREL